MNLLSVTSLRLANLVCVNTQIVFQTDKEWREYVLGVNELERLNYLLGMALGDEDMGHRLMMGDSEFCTEWELSEQTQVWMRSVKALSLEEFAIALCEELSSQKSFGISS